MDRTLEFQAQLYLERGEGGQSEGEVSGPVCGEGGFTCLGCGYDHVRGVEVVMCDICKLCLGGDCCV